MKKFLLFASVLILCCAVLFSGCGGAGSSENAPSGADSATSNTSGGDDFPEGIDPDSTDVQQVSDKKALKEKLSETVTEWMGNATAFPADSEIGKSTYKDFVDHIGCDATEYYFDSGRNARVFTWKSEESDNSKLGVWFVERGGNWCASMSGANNLS